MEIDAIVAAGKWRRNRRVSAYRRRMLAALRRLFIIRNKHAAINRRLGWRGSRMSATSAYITAKTASNRYRQQSRPLRLW
jgi:hypothetical protein